ncbi:hypothetical protein Pint_34603 [Pistacia integerrima]|uniref:Uncharacterized protein n=1 Tax=Pistacia integerrima TaxID=434235 RepID=A0ACC0X725_9ROSI|nr:hypothetical protein Pint_34603 [Pistacia integerrima]
MQRRVVRVLSVATVRVYGEVLLHPTPAVRHCLICVVGIHFFQQSSVVAGRFLKILFILVARFLLDRIGRQPLLLSSVAGMILSLATLRFSLTVIDHSHVRLPWAVGLALTTVLSYNVFFLIGRNGTHHMGLQLRDLPVAAMRLGSEYASCNE